MSTLASYSDLVSSVPDWAGDRTYSTARINEFIVVAESYASRKLGQHYRRATSTTLTADSDGIATLPTDFAELQALYQPGEPPMKVVTWAALQALNPDGIASTPTHCALQGGSVKVAPVYAGSLTLDYWAKLVGLGDNNATNWLLTQAPDVYLFYCRAAQALFEEEFAQGQTFRALGDQALDDLIAQSARAQYGAAGAVTIPGLTP